MSVIWPAEDVYFDHHVVDRDSAGASVELEVDAVEPTWGPLRGGTGLCITGGDKIFNRFLNSRWFPTSMKF